MVLLGEQIKEGRNVKLTNKDFQLFKKECNKWISKFELHDWDIVYEFTRNSSDAGGCHTKYEDCQATIKFDSDFIDGHLISKSTHIKETAKHEMIELMLAPINILGKSRVFDETEFNHQRHRIIMKLMRIL